MASSTHDDGWWTRAVSVTRWPQRFFEAPSSTLQDRLIGALLFVPSITVLGIARALTPNPAGYGTHRQLGLGPCAVFALTGYPCPMCGMTTTFTWFAHLHPVKALLNQPFGLVLFSCTVAAAMIGGMDLLYPNGRWRRALGWIERHETLAASVLLVGMIVGWVYKIALVKGLLPWGP